MSPRMSASPVRGNLDDSESLPFTCCPQGTLPCLQEGRLFARGHPPPMCHDASRTSESQTEESGHSRPLPLDRRRGRGSRRGGCSDPRDDPTGREARSPRADEPALDRNGRMALASLRLPWNVVLQAVGRGMLAAHRCLADRCPLPREALPSGGTTGSPPSRTPRCSCSSRGYARRDREGGAMRRIYCFVNARGQGGRTDVLVEALCEDGDFLATIHAIDRPSTPNLK